jgi:tRNA-2-methylthio-N6-dimethylallyladenosine synthase
MTLDVIREVQYDGAFTFLYSPRENTKAYTMPVDIPDEVRRRRMEEIITLQREISYDINRKMIGKTKRVLVESLSRKSDNLQENKLQENQNAPAIGDMIDILITNANSATLFGDPVNAHSFLANSICND